MAKRNHVWVVEMRNPNTGKFETTSGVGLDREDGREQLEIWRDKNPDDKFRLRKYAAE